MIDIFLMKDFTQLLKHKKVVFLGDSNIRALYKDFLCLSQQNRFISQKILKTKMENSCFGDQLVFHGQKSNGRTYREERKASVNGIKLSFYFLTSIFNDYVEKILEKITHESTIPDVFIINSCLWDVTRWGPNGVDLFKKNLVSMMKKLKRLFPESLVIWVTAPPISVDLRGGFLVKELEFLKYSLRFHVMEANQYARKVVVEHGFDVLDSHYHLQYQLNKRNDDGIHWVPSAVRYVTNLLLAHISLAWNVPLPHRYKSCEEDLDSTLDTESQSEPVSKITSVVVNPSSTLSDKHSFEMKENFIKGSKSSRKKKAKTQLSHHAFISRQNQMERQKRIRNWQPDTFNDNPPQCSSSYQRRRVYDFQSNNNEYFPQTPRRVVSIPHNYVPPSEPMHFPSPRQIPLLSSPFSTYYSPRYSPLVNQDSRQVVYSPIFQSSQPYLGDIDYREPRSFQFRDRYQPYQYPRINRESEPYQFPDINRNPEPRIDFSSNEIPFGMNF